MPKKNKNNKKKVLLTTISTKPFALGVNLYKINRDNKPRVCIGISQLEPGTKAILSSGRMNRIVAICSEAARDGKDKTDQVFKLKDLWPELKQEWKKDMTLASFSAVRLYAFRIAAFLYGDDECNDDLIVQKLIECYCLRDGICEKLTDYDDLKLYVDVDTEIELQDEFIAAISEDFLNGKFTGDNGEIYSNFNKVNKGCLRDYLWYRVYEHLSEYRLLNDKDSEDYYEDLELVIVDANLPKVMRQNGIDYPDEIDNLGGIVEKITDVSTDVAEIELYIDVQGGTRATQFTVYNVIQMLCDEGKYAAKKKDGLEDGQAEDDITEEVMPKVALEKVYATQFNHKNPLERNVVDETGRYEVINAVSGMNAFIRYGKTASLQTYFAGPIGKNKSRIEKLGNRLYDFDHALNEKKPEELKKVFEEIVNMDSIPEADVETAKDSVYNILLEMIRREMSGIIHDGKVDYCSLASWCLKHSLTDQAYIIIADATYDKLLGYLGYDENNLKEQFFAYMNIRTAKRAGLDINNKIIDNGKGKDYYEGSVDKKNNSELKAWGQSLLFVLNDIKENKKKCRYLETTFSEQQIEILEHFWKIKNFRNKSTAHINNNKAKSEMAIQKYAKEYLKAVGGIEKEFDIDALREKYCLYKSKNDYKKSRNIEDKELAEKVADWSYIIEKNKLQSAFLEILKNEYDLWKNGEQNDHDLILLCDDANKSKGRDDYHDWNKDKRKHGNRDKVKDKREEDYDYVSKLLVDGFDNVDDYTFGLLWKELILGQDVIKGYLRQKEKDKQRKIEDDERIRKAEEEAERLKRKLAEGDKTVEIQEAEVEGSENTSQERDLDALTPFSIEETERKDDADGIAEPLSEEVPEKQSEGFSDKLPEEVSETSSKELPEELSDSEFGPEPVAGVEMTPETPAQTIERLERLLVQKQKYINALESRGFFARLFNTKPKMEDY